MPALAVGTGGLGKDRLRQRRRGEPRAGDVDLVFACEHVLARYRRCAADIGHDAGAAELTAVAGGAHLADRRAVAQDELAAPGKDGGVFKDKNGEALLGAALALLQESLAADEVAFVEFDGVEQAGLERRL